MNHVGVLRDRFTLGVIAVGVVMVGVIALTWPVHLSDYDRWGFRVSCGSALVADYDQALRADESPPAAVDGTSRRPDFTGECGMAIAWRRAEAATLIVLGAAGVTALIPRRSGGRRQSEAA